TKEFVMVRTARVLVVLAILAGTPPVPPGYAQTPGRASAPPAPAPSTAAQPDPLPGLPHPPDQPRSLLEPAPPLAPPFPPLPGPYFERDTLLDPSPLPPPGWFVGVEVGVVAAHVKNKLSNPVQLGTMMPDTVQLPSAELDWTVAPRFEL